GDVCDSAMSVSFRERRRAGRGDGSRLVAATAGGCDVGRNIATGKPAHHLRVGVVPDGDHRLIRLIKDEDHTTGDTGTGGTDHVITSAGAKLRMAGGQEGDCSEQSE